MRQDFLTPKFFVAAISSSSVSSPSLFYRSMDDIEVWPILLDRMASFLLAPGTAA